MRSTAFLCTGSILLASLALPVAAADTPRGFYQLNMQLHDGDRLVGSPRLTVAAGETSHIDIGDAVGNHYTLAFTITPRSAETALFTSTIDVSAKGRQQMQTPSLEVALGKPATIAFGEEGPTTKPFRVDFTISKAD